VVILPFCLLRQAWIHKPKFLPVWWTLLPSHCWFLLLTRFHCASEAFTPTHQEDKFLLWIKLSIGTWWDLLLVVQGMHPSDKGSDKSQSPQSWTIPKKCCGNLKLRYGTLKQFIRKQHFIVPSQTQQTHIQSLSPENKGVSPYTCLQAGYISKK
jgi:hypothetical protein